MGNGTFFNMTVSLCQSKERVSDFHFEVSSRLSHTAQLQDKLDCDASLITRVSDKPDKPSVCRLLSIPFLSSLHINFMPQYACVEGIQ